MRKRSNRSFKSILPELLENRRMFAAAPAGPKSVDIDNVHYYVATDDDHGTELWKSDLDGSNASVIDVWPGPTGSRPDWLFNFNGTLYFSADGNFDSVGRELFKSDGTIGGTELVADIYDHGQNSDPNTFMIVNGKLLFLARPQDTTDQLYVTDGTEAGTIKLFAHNSDPSLPKSITGLAKTTDLLYFDGYSEAHSRAVRWQTDGTLVGTQPLAIQPVNGVLTIDGTAGDDVIKVEPSGGIKVTINGQSVYYSASLTKTLVVNGLDGNDTIEVFLYNNLNPIVHGGAGNDTITLKNLDTRWSINSQEVDFNKGYLPGTVYGDEGDDTFIGRNYGNEYFGGEGSDTIDYTNGAFSIYRWENPSGYPNSGRWYVKSTTKAVSVSLDDIANDGRWGDENVHSDIEKVIGSNGKDVLIAGNGPTTLLGGLGDDKLVGDINDSLDGEAGTNTTIVRSVTLNDGKLQILGTSLAEQILVEIDSGNPSLLKVSIGLFTQTFNLSDVTSIFVDAGSSDDRVDLRGVAIASRIYGRDGHDKIYGGATNDRIYGGAGNDWISAGAGKDIVYGEAGDDHIFGGAGKDYLVGGAGTDLIRGEGGVDQIFAKTGDNRKANKGDLIKLVQI